MRCDTIRTCAQTHCIQQRLPTAPDLQTFDTNHARPGPPTPTLTSFISHSPLFSKAARNAGAPKSVGPSGGSRPVGFRRTLPWASYHCMKPPTIMLSWQNVFAFVFFQITSFMAALCNRAGHIYFHPVVCSSFFFLFFLSSPTLSRRRLDVYHTCTHGVALVRISDAGLKRAARGSLQIQDGIVKNRHLGTIA